MKFVLDALVTSSWLLRDANDRDAAYAFSVLRRLGIAVTEIAVPVTWTLEVANVIARCEAKGQVTPAQSEAFLEMLRVAAISVDPATEGYALSDTSFNVRR